MVRSVGTVEILPLFYLPEMDLLLQWLREAILSADPRVHPGLHRRSEEPLISPCLSYSSSKISQHATRLRRGDSQSWLTSGGIQETSGLAFTRKNEKKKVSLGMCVNPEDDKAFVADMHVRRSGEAVGGLSLCINTVRKTRLVRERSGNCDSR